MQGMDLVGLEYVSISKFVQIVSDSVSCINAVAFRTIGGYTVEMTMTVCIYLSL
jgi:hypothetical protein